MMNRAVKKFTSAALALAMMMSMGVAANAKPLSSKGTNTGAKSASSTTASAAPVATANDYSINVVGNDVQFIRGGKAVATYGAKTPDIKLMRSQSGNLVLNFIKSDGKGINVSLGQQKVVSFTGSYNTLTIDGTVPNDRAVSIGGAVGTLNVNAPINATATANANITSLKVGSGTAKVNLESGAKIAKAAAVTASSVTGFSGSISKMQAVTAPAATTVNATSKKTGLKVGGSTSTSASNAGKEKVYLNMNEADDTKNTEEINFTTSNGVELVAKDGVSLGLAMKDVKLEVTHDTDKDNDRVGGSWKWVDAASTTHVSGTYTYRFYPSLSSKYPTVDVKVKYVGDGDSKSTKSLGKPSISFVGKSHGAGGNVSVEVRIPSGVDDDATLTIYVDRDAYNEWNLDEDDAGEENTYTIAIEPGDYDLSEDDVEVRVQAKVESDGRKTSSNTIKYRLEGNSSPTKLKDFYISASGRATKGDNYDINVRIPSGLTNPKLTASFKKGSGSISGTGSVSSGSHTITVKPNKTGRARVSVTLRCDEGSRTDFCEFDVED